MDIMILKKINKKEKKMSKKTINVFEIHSADSEIEILEVGSEYAKTIKNGVNIYGSDTVMPHIVVNIYGSDTVIPHIVMDKSDVAVLKDGRKAICYKISFIKELKEDFIKTLSNEFSHAYIIMAPDKKGLIVDFSLDTSVYDMITEKLKIKK